MIDAATKKLITNSAYYHLKHYEDYGGNNTELWIKKINDTIEEAKKALQIVIERQKERETIKLDQIFGGTVPSLKEMVEIGFTQTEGAYFINNFTIGKTSKNINERVEALNNLCSRSFNITTGDAKNGLEKATRIIADAFSDAGATGNVDFKTLQEEYDFISALVAVLTELDKQVNSPDNKMIRELLQASVRKLNSAIKFYSSDYNQKLAKTENAFQKIEDLTAKLQTYIDVYGIKNWTNHKLDRNFNAVSAVIKRSADGFMKTSQGAAYENFVANIGFEALKDIFKNTEVTIMEGKSTVTGLNTDKSTKKSQKGDVRFDFTLSSTSHDARSFSMSFSVKRKESGSSIQIHHGGSVFSYSNRLNQNNFGVDFNFLNEGNFHYVFVNELAKAKGNFIGGSDFTSAFYNLVQSFGWVFLGQEVSNNIQGADFLFIQGKIYPFSSILEKIRLNSGQYINTVVKMTEKEPITEKVNLLKRYPLQDFKPYNEGFINESIKIGKNAIYGTTFSIYLNGAR